MDAKIIPLEFNKIFTQKITDDWLQHNEVTLDVLRLDLLHPVVSGNKWFKLKCYIAEATEQGKDTIATFGGAFSNHIIATAYACKTHGLKSIGFIRGEEHEQLSHTLTYATQLGMKLNFINRKDYRNKEAIITQNEKEDIYWVEEGGYGAKGAEGAAEILQYTDHSNYNYIAAAVGTGTLLAGLIKASSKDQYVIGVSSMKGNTSLTDGVKKLLPPNKLLTSFEILHDYHFGGYAKHPPQLINFINDVYAKHQLPLDIVYTSKAFYAIKDLVNTRYFSRGSSILMIHSGGLQGNGSLPQGVLSFL
jgi:1-aminocyclopropane-1-carboxylate deaminase